MAEAHPVGFQWVIEAKARGAKVIHVDPRFTRTSAHADLYVPIRAGSDIAFLGGVVNYILSNEKDFREYVLAYTNASFIVSERFEDTEDLDGLFSGYHADTATYDQSTWQYEGMPEPPAAGHRIGQGTTEHTTGDHFGAGGPALHGEAPHPPSDPTLQHPRCVWQVLKRHYSRYTPEMVEAICGIPQELFLEVCLGGQLRP
jgi:formate dehydrogenase major subunit